jgi:hypothetical protein
VAQSLLTVLLGSPSHASAPMNLRVPHPCFLRVGSYDPTPQTLRSSLRTLCCL